MSGGSPTCVRDMEEASDDLMVYVNIRMSFTEIISLGYKMIKKKNGLLNICVPAVA